jgi:hypothetical protein
MVKPRSENVGVRAGIAKTQFSTVTAERGVFRCSNRMYGFCRDDADLPDLDLSICRRRDVASRALTRSRKRPHELLQGDPVLRLALAASTLERPGPTPA